MPTETGLLARVYAAVYAPQDRLVERLLPRPSGRRTLTLVANLGLSTQLAVLGVCLLAGAPEAYLWFCLACLAAVAPLALRRRAGTAAAERAF